MDLGSQPCELLAKALHVFALCVFSLSKRTGCHRTAVFMTIFRLIGSKKDFFILVIAENWPQFYSVDPNVNVPGKGICFFNKSRAGFCEWVDFHSRTTELIVLFYQTKNGELKKCRTIFFNHLKLHSKFLKKCFLKTTK